MKRLTLVRHAKSRWTESTLPDHARPLAKRGQREAVWLADTLARELPEPDRLLTSDARRALATADALQAQWPALSPEMNSRLYLATPQTLLKVLRQLPDEVEHVLLVGHHPGLSELACQLVPTLPAWLDQKPSEQNGRLEPVLVTAAAVSLTTAIDSWQQLGHAPVHADALLTPAQGVLFSARKPARSQSVQQAVLVDLGDVQHIVELDWEPAAEDVHFLRTRIKRLRAGLRLLQPLLSAEQWRTQDDALRTLARRYAPLRELDVALQFYGEQPVRRSLRHRLWQEHLTAEVRLQTLAQLKQWSVQARQWSTMTLTDRQIVADIARSYRRARQAAGQAQQDPSPDALHRWRLQVKRLLLQVELASTMLPDKRMLQRLRRLADVLGEQHDHEQLLQANVDAPADRREQWQQTAITLTARALDLGGKLFVDKRPRWLAQCMAHGDSADRS